VKLLFCENCADLVVPDQKPNKPTWCRCQSACCWWIDPHAGRFGCWSGEGKENVSIIGINNALLTEPFSTHYSESTGKTHEYGCIQKDKMERMIDETPATYLFRQIRSLIIRIRPGFSNDTIFTTPPSNAGVGG